MPQHSSMSTVLLKLAKVERLKSRKFWVHVLVILSINSTCMDPKFFEFEYSYDLIPPPTASPQ